LKKKTRYYYFRSTFSKARHFRSIYPIHTSCQCKVRFSLRKFPRRNGRRQLMITELSMRALIWFDFEANISPRNSRNHFYFFHGKIFRRTFYSVYNIRMYYK